ncbi:MAG: type II toxin-antitoxin system RelE/ParE family toxin [Cyanobacteria bacterium]|nr:type II toxin-antitoxin system RelE/ParE family toxin [Cyanobacteriota bacterium]
MQNDPPPIEVDPSPNFIRDLRELSKSYRHIKSDLQPLIDQLLQGETPGDRIKGVKSLAEPPGTGIVYKVRLKNSDVQKGKSGGYRALYYLKSQDKILLVAIYSKSDRTDIDATTIIDIITQYENQFLN